MPTEPSTNLITPPARPRLAWVGGGASLDPRQGRTSPYLRDSATVNLTEVDGEEPV